MTTFGALFRSQRAPLYLLILQRLEEKLINMEYECFYHENQLHSLPLLQTKFVIF